MKRKIEELHIVIRYTKNNKKAKHFNENIDGDCDDGIRDFLSKIQANKVDWKRVIKTFTKKQFASRNLTKQTTELRNIRFELFKAKVLHHVIKDARSRFPCTTISFASFHHGPEAFVKIVLAKTRTSPLVSEKDLIAQQYDVTRHMFQTMSKTPFLKTMCSEFVTSNIHVRVVGFGRFSFVKQTWWLTPKNTCVKNFIEWTGGPLRYDGFDVQKSLYRLLPNELGAMVQSFIGSGFQDFFSDCLKSNVQTALIEIK